jgi:thiol:disulfide interchange protein DsbC
MMSKRILLALWLLATAAAAPADEAGVRKIFESKFPQSKVESVTKTQYGGLYEVFMDRTIHYTDEKVSFFIVGALVDTSTSRNVTEQRMRKLTALNLKEMPPLSMAIKRVKGDGKRQLFVFSDPMCPFCKRLEQELAKVTNVTVYLYLFPTERTFPGSTALAKSIWCSADRAKAWEDLVLRAKEPTVKGTCANPVEQIAKLGGNLGIASTPTIVFGDGAPLAGAVSATDIERLLTQTVQ